MKTNDEPLMFINSVSKINKDNEEKIFDSRKNVVKKKEDINDYNIKEIQKIYNMIKLYNNNKIVVCNIKTIDTEVECIPVKIEDDKIVVRKTDSTITNIDIKNILNVEIVHI